VATPTSWWPACASTPACATIRVAPARLGASGSAGAAPSWLVIRAAISPSNFPLTGKVALITGAARGIGFETARLLHERGASVLLTDLDREATEKAADSIGERSLALAADATNREALDAAVAATVDRIGGST
jgi:NADPH:quinone reductase-like Zn-dependent oxidoreductase